MSRIAHNVFLAGKQPPTYVDDVFSTYLYTGNGSTQTITNGIDLAGKGGLVWIKDRNLGDQRHHLFDTVRGAGRYVVSDQTSGEVDASPNYLTSFNSNGFTYGLGDGNTSGGLFVSWTFRKQAKFFDIVTYTGNGANRTISHNLGSVPGCIIVKRTDTTADWQVYHRSLSNTEYLVLNTTAAKATGTTRWNSTTATATDFSLGTDTTVNANTGTYVAYLFAHDTAADGLIQCGSFTTDSGGNYSVTLGWEPQWVLWKNTGAIEDWRLIDSMRGWGNGGAAVNDDAVVYSNSSAAEFVTRNGSPTATGFASNGQTAGVANSATYIYIAIRRPNKPPTSGAQVFQPTVYTGTNVDNRLVNTTIAPDMVWVRKRDTGVTGSMRVADRLRGQPYLQTAGNEAEVNTADAFDAQLVLAVEYGNAFSSMNGFWCGNDITADINRNTTSNNHIAEAFKRAPGVFDIVCYTGTGVAKTEAHNLGVVPELMIVKNRSDATGRAWAVYYGDNTDYLHLNQQVATADDITYWNDTSPTSSVFTVGTNNATNESGDTFVAYLFATKAGISKVGTYTGNGGTFNNNGTSQTINCGFSAGARFVLIKRTDSEGDWYVFDSARGIVAASDPYLLTNSSALEETNVDAVDADNSGFIVNQTNGTNLNVTNATYIYLAFA